MGIVFQATAIAQGDNDNDAENVPGQNDGGQAPGPCNHGPRGRGGPGRGGPGRMGPGRGQTPPPSQEGGEDSTMQ